LLLLAVVGGCWRLLAVVGGCWRLLEVVGGCWRLLVVVGGCWRLLLFCQQRLLLGLARQELVGASDCLQEEIKLGIVVGSMISHFIQGLGSYPPMTMTTHSSWLSNK
jgi:hypothetical protein